MKKELKEYHEQVIFWLEDDSLTKYDILAHAKELRAIAGLIDNDKPGEILNY